MTENVALTKKKQKSFNKSIKKTKDKIKKGDIKITEKSPKPFRRSFKGIVYVSNIPHGFYEKQLKGYFGQFGDVLKVRVGRSKKTGKGKGHAFIQFKDQEVAKIAAETMNNYLMDKRLIKAKFLTEDKKTKGLFKKPSFSIEHYPTLVRRIKFKKAFNAAVPEDIENKKTKHALKHIENVAKKLKALGIDYDFQPEQTTKMSKSVKENDDADSSSDDIIFTSPEEMKKRSKELTEIKFKKNIKRKIIDNKDTSSSKKVKKSINKNTGGSEVPTKALQKKQKNKPPQEKKNKLEDEINNANGKNKIFFIKEKQQNKNNQEINENSINKKNKNTPNKNKKATNENIAKHESKTTPIKIKKQKKQNKINLDNSDNTNKNHEIKKKLRKKQKENKSILGHTEGNANDNNENLEKEKQKKVLDKSIIKTNKPEKKDKKQLKTKISRIENISKKIVLDKSLTKTNKAEKKDKKQMKSKIVLDKSLTPEKKDKKKNKIRRIENQQTDISNKIIGVIKKSKKALKPVKLSDKKANLIRTQIQANDQVKTIKQIEKKNSPGKKKKKSINVN